MPATPDATTRFSSRVADYTRYRPGYPPAALDLLRESCGLRPGSAVADLGSGTGILSALLLESGATVYGVEPNADMRAAAEALLAGQERFVSVAGAAEATGLPAASADLITAGQAFHWFDPPAARAEAKRILKPGGSAALIWNSRQLGTTPFLAGYESLLQRWGTDYAEVSSRYAAERSLRAFFGAKYRTAVFPNEQRFDLAGLEGRLRSSSYTPPPGNPRFEPMMADLAALFAAHAQDGQVAFLYDTEVYYGVVV